MTKVLVERELLETVYTRLQDTLDRRAPTMVALRLFLSQPAHDVEASVPTFPCEFCGAFHSYSEVAEADGYCPQCEANYDERQMFADLLARYTALAAAPKAETVHDQQADRIADLERLLLDSRGFVEAYVKNTFFGPNARGHLIKIDAALKGTTV